MTEAISEGNTPDAQSERLHPITAVKKAGEKLQASRFRRLLEAPAKLFAKKPAVEGREMLPQGRNYVVATTHLSDIDVQAIAAEIALDRKVGVVSQKTNRENPWVHAGMKLAGEEHFYDIANTFDYKTRKKTYQFVLDDFAGMEEGIKEGKTMVIAAHKPTYDWKLPNSGGIGAVYLAHFSGLNLVVPAALDIHSPVPVGNSDNSGGDIRNFTIGKRPESTIRMADAVELQDIPREDVEKVGLYLQSGKRREMSASDRERAKQMLKIMLSESRQVMNALALQLPPEKRGKWPVTMDEGTDEELPAAPEEADG